MSTACGSIPWRRDWCRARLVHVLCDGVKIVFHVEDEEHQPSAVVWERRTSRCPVSCCAMGVKIARTRMLNESLGCTRLHIQGRSSPGSRGLSPGLGPEPGLGQFNFMKRVSCQEKCLWCKTTEENKILRWWGGGGIGVAEHQGFP